MAQAKRDDNNVPTILGVSKGDGQTVVPITVDSANHALSVDNGQYSLVPNPDFADQPVFVAATSTNGRFIDGTAAGSATDDTYGWGYGTSGTSTSSANFDTVATRTAIKITATALDKAGASVDLVMVANVPAYSGPTLPLSTLAYAMPVTAGYVYTFSMDYYLESLSNPAEVNAQIRITWYNAAGTRVSQTGTAIINNAIFTTWTSLSPQNFTAPATAVYATFGPSIQAAGADGSGRAMTAYFTNIQVSSANIQNPQRALRDENFVPTLLAVSSVDGETPVVLYTTTDGKLLIDSN